LCTYSSRRVCAPALRERIAKAKAVSYHLFGSLDKPGQTADRLEVCFSGRKNFRRLQFECATGKEDAPDSLLVRYPRDPDAPDTERLAPIKEAASNWSSLLFTSWLSLFSWSLLSQRKDSRCRSCQILIFRSCQVLKCSLLCRIFWN